MSRFPQPFISTTSHWQATNRGPTSLYNHNAEASLPETADIVIVGGGTMGASLAYFLTREGAEGAGKRVVLLEAKDIASGACEYGGRREQARYFSRLTWRCPLIAAGRNGGQ